MATSKLLKPTNVTISIPEFTDQPDQRVNSNCIDKEADAINSLSDQIGGIIKVSSPNLDLQTYPANSDTVVTVNSSWTNKRVISVSAIGEYPSGVNQKLIITSFWQFSNTLYICVRNITNGSVSGVLQVNIFYQDT